MALVKNTPIRLVALDEEPPHDDTTHVQDFLLDEDTAPTPSHASGPAQDASPVRVTPEHEAITRRVPALPEVAQVPEWPKPRRTWRRFIPVAVAVVPLVGLSTFWFLSKPAQESTSAARTQTAKTIAPALTPPPGTPSPSANAPDTIRLRITATPTQAELALDGNVLAGHRLNLEVPKDRGIHVVSASAPGYLPFNQQVIFSDDVVLNISLRRTHGPAGRAMARPRHSPVESRTPVASRPTPPSPAQAEANPPSSSKSSPAPSAPRLEPGMDLDALTPGRGSKSIDERNPYRP